MSYTGPDIPCKNLLLVDLFTLYADDNGRITEEPVVRQRPDVKTSVEDTEVEDLQFLTDVGFNDIAALREALAKSSFMFECIARVKVCPDKIGDAVVCEYIVEPVYSMPENMPAIGKVESFNDFGIKFEGNRLKMTKGPVNVLSLSNAQINELIKSQFTAVKGGSRRR